MAPKKEVRSLGSTQPVDDGWRAEVSNVGKGPTRATLAEAVRDLDAAQQANTREEMKTFLGQLRQEARSAQSLTDRCDGAEPGIPLRQVAPEEAAALGSVPSLGIAARSSDDEDSESKRCRRWGIGASRGRDHRLEEPEPPPAQEPAVASPGGDRAAADNGASPHK